MPIRNKHFVSGHLLKGPFPAGLETAVFGMGCFWGAERVFWQMPGVYSTAVGYAGGFTPNPSYEEVCSGMTGHTEAVRVVFDPKLVSYEALLKTFWESHRPDRGHAPGQRFRHAIPFGDLRHDAGAEGAGRSLAEDAYAKALADDGFRDPITTEIADARPVRAADYHQQYLNENPERLLWPRGHRCNLSDLGEGGGRGVTRRP